MSDPLYHLICQTILVAQDRYEDPLPAAEKAGKAYAAGLTAYREAATPPPAAAPSAE